MTNQLPSSLIDDLTQMFAAGWFSRHMVLRRSAAQNGSSLRGLATRAADDTARRGELAAERDKKLLRAVGAEL